MNHEIEILKLKLKVALGHLETVQLSEDLITKCDPNHHDYYLEQKRKAIKAFSKTMTSLIEDCLPENLVL